LFEPGGVALSTLQSYKLARVAQALRKQAGTIIVQAYTDSLGSEDEARALSLRRAQAIASFLRRSGVRAARLSAEGLGPANPIDDNATPEGRERNRRVELVLQATTSREADGSAAR
jgi:outer membrane protein OmpA-like peptidoglycan-associated protein